MECMPLLLLPGPIRIGGTIIFHLSATTVGVGEAACIHHLAGEWVDFTIRGILHGTPGMVAMA